MQNIDDPIMKLLNENNNENIVLYDDNNRAVEFEQVAIIPLNYRLYAILKPATKIEGIADNEALVFAIGDIDDEEQLTLERDKNITEKVFEIFYKKMEES